MCQHDGVCLYIENFNLHMMPSTAADGIKQ